MPHKIIQVVTFLVLCFGKLIAQSNLPCGQVMSGALSSPSEIAQYTFTIPTGGDLIALNLASTTPNFTPILRLYNPAGTQINSDTNFATEVVTQAGTYRMTVSYSSGTVTAGGFRLSRQSLRNPCNATAIQCGGNLLNRLEQLSEMDAYTFNGTTGDPIKLQIGSNKLNGFDPQIRLYAPDGDFLNSSNVDITRTLPQTGVYKVLVLQSTGTGRIGEYGLTLQNTRAPCNAQSLDCGALRYGSIKTLAAFDTYTFTAMANEPFMLWMVTTTRDTNSQTAGSYFNAEMALYSPVGTRLTSVVSNESGQLVRTPTVSGTYTLIVHSATGDEAGDYQLSFQRLKNPCNATPLSSCQRVKAAISVQAEIDTYTISGTAGQSLPIQVSEETTNFTPNASFYDPDGLSASGTRPLTKTGPYTLVVKATGGTGMTGNYTVSLGSSTITVTSPLSGEMLLAGTTERIAWETSSTSTGTTFDILLSTDGGATYPTTIATGISRTTLFYNWLVPANLTTSRARIRIVSKDTTGSSCSANSEADFFVIVLGAGSTVNYKYDDLNQLIEASYDNGTKFTYTYDAVGNRLSETVTSSTVTLATVATTAATAITAISATLNGTANPNGSATSTWFEWGTNNALANAASTPIQPVGEGRDNLAVTANLTSLIPATTYYFRLVSSNGAGISRGAILSFNTPVAQPATSVSAASYNAAALSPESIAAVFGGSLATRVEVANTVPLPTSLAGTSVKFRDSAGKESLAQLFFVSPGQVNYLVPADLAAGTVLTIITSENGIISAGTTQIDTIAPGLFSANADGQGVAAAYILRVKADGTQIVEPVAQFDQTAKRFVAVPIDPGPVSDQLFLVVFGTGLRGRNDISSVRAQVGGIDVEILYAGPQGSFVGLDQVNLSLPRSLAGKGEVQVQLSVQGKPTNTLTIRMK